MWSGLPELPWAPQLIWPGPRPGPGAGAGSSTASSTTALVLSISTMATMLQSYDISNTHSTNYGAHHGVGTGPVTCKHDDGVRVLRRHPARIVSAITHIGAAISDNRGINSTVRDSSGRH